MRPSPARVLAQSGFSMLEVLIAALVIGITISGVATMYGHGTSWMAAMGDDRVALSLAQERIETIRAAGWTSEMAAPGITPEEEVRPARIATTRADKGNARAYRRVTCVQNVAPSSTPDAGDLALPAYDPTCPPGADSETRRITVVVVPVGGDGAEGSPATPEPSAITLQGWITKSGL
jgi:prepilin-type N-terminal cleavage/methylation domain-containing protein